jgi:hypothetical protein
MQYGIFYRLMLHWVEFRVPTVKIRRNDSRNTKVQFVGNAYDSY